MFVTKSALLACGMAVALFSAAGAAQSSTMKDRSLVILEPGGSSTAMTVTDKAHAMIMKNARRLPQRTIVYRSGKDFYLLEDRKMASGRMMFDDLLFDRAKGHVSAY